jgi:hypothetical protein
MFRHALFACAFLALSSAVPASADEVKAGLIRTAASGAWSDIKTWGGAKLPVAGDRVQIRAGHHVVYDRKSEDVIRSIHVAGTLSFAADRDTELNVGLIKIQPGDDASEDGFNCDAHMTDPDPKQPKPALEIGTPEKPLDAKFTAKIRLHYVEGMDKEACPAIVCCGGRMDLHGAPMNRTWVKLGANAPGGDKAVSLSEAVTGWRKGDHIIVTASNRNGDDMPSRRPGGKGPKLLTEERTIATIDGTKIEFEQPLEINHLGSGDYRAEVANLSRNVIVESADPKGVRGHTMYHRNSAGSISYAEFRHLGKEGILGKYSIHYHLVGDTMRGSSVFGASIWDSGNRWVTIHGTNYLLVKDCVGYQSIGHGFFLEDGTEEFNVLDRNLAVQAFKGKKLPKQALPFDQNEGAGYWWANSLNTFTRNVSCENDRYGFRFEATQGSSFKVTLPVMQPDGTRKPLDIRTLPFVRFDDNESHSEGLYGMNIGEGVNRVGPDTSHPFIMRNTRIWDVHYAFRPQVPNLLVEKMWIYRAAYGVYHPNYDNHVYRDMYIGKTDTEPFNRGHDDDSVQYGVLTVDGLTFDGIRSGDFMPLIQISDDNPTGNAVTHIRNLKVENWTGSKNRAIVNLGGGPRPTPKTEKGVPIYVYDYFGEGKHARIVSTKTKELKNDGLEYRAVPNLTGDESRAAEVHDLVFPKLIDPVEDLPPATVITQAVRQQGGKLLVRGFTSSNAKVKKVLVNQHEAKATAANFAEWEIVLEANNGKLEAFAEDAAGNVEKHSHAIAVK